MGVEIPCFVCYTAERLVNLEMQQQEDAQGNNNNNNMMTTVAEHELMTVVTYLQVLVDEAEALAWKERTNQQYQDKGETDSRADFVSSTLKVPEGMYLYRWSLYQA